MAAAKLEKELKQFLFESFPCIPFTAKKNAKQFFDGLTIFKPGQNTDWVDTQPDVVLSAFILFFSKKRLEGIQIDNIDGLITDTTVPIKQRIKTFIENGTGSQEELKAIRVNDLPVRVETAPYKAIDNKRARLSSEPNPKAPKILMVVLVGLPGSGKTTFCEHLRKAFAEDDAVEIRRLSQDETSKEACERDAHYYTSGGRGEANAVVIVDRTNVTQEQRAIWVQIAKRYRRSCIAVDLKVDERCCIERAMARTDHPTLQSSQVPRVVIGLSKAYKAPKLSEGFDEVVVGGADLSVLLTEIKRLWRALPSTST